MKFPQYIIPILLLSFYSANGQNENQGNFKPTVQAYGTFQFWVRYTELNPESTVQSKSTSGIWDLSIRRYRLGFKGLLTDRVSYNLQFGNNSLNRTEPGKSPKLLDAYIDTKLNKYVTVTVGKNGWTGLSRYAAPSTSGALGNDINYSATPLLNIHDDFFRRLSIAIHGQAGQWDYRFIFGKPLCQASDQELSADAVMINAANAIHTSAYFKYQFFDKESQTSPFNAWTYHGEKELLNIGAGFFYQTQASQTINTAGDTLTHPVKSVAIDVFYERYNHFLKGSLTFYGTWIRHDLGPNYVRNLGVNNPADGLSGNSTFNGKGNAFPTTGTGDILLFQTALFKSFTTTAGEGYGIQPYFTMEYAQFDALQSPATMYETGINYLVKGNAAKITLGYQSRPIFIASESEWISDGHSSMAVLQYQVKF